jgi:hypothetical protein
MTAIHSSNGSSVEDSRAVYPQASEASGTSKLVFPVPAAGAGAPVEHDLIARNRDRHGNRLPWFASFHVPHVEDVSLEESHLRKVLERIAEARPGRAWKLAHEYEEKVVRAFLRFRKIREEEEGRVAAYNVWVSDLNAAVDRQQDSLRRQQDEALRPHREQLAGLRTRLEAAHAIAQTRVAQVGGLYQPANPCEEDVLLVRRRSLAEIAPEEGMPDVENDQEDLLVKALGWLMTALVGLMAGTSLALMGGFIHPDTIQREWGAAVGFALAGFGAAAFARKAIVHLYRLAAERSYLRQPGKERAVAWGVAHALALAVLGIDCTVEREGLLKLARSSADLWALSGQAAHGRTPSWVYFTAALLATVGYVIYSAVEGYIRGRRGVVRNHLVRVQEGEAEQKTWRRREQVEVRAALEAVSQVKGLQLLHEEEETRLAEAAGPWDECIAVEEAKRRSPQEALADEAHRRIQDALDNLLGAQERFDRELEAELELLEPSWGWAQRLGHLLYPRRKRNSTREQRRRIR